MDLTLSIMILVFSLCLLIIPLFFEVRNVKGIKDKKNRLLRIEKKGYSIWGKLFIVFFLLSVGVGISKIFIDKSDTEKQKIAQSEFQSKITEVDIQLKKTIFRDSTNYMNLVIRDSTIFSKVERSLAANNIKIDSNYNIIKGKVNFGIIINNSNLSHNRNAGIIYNYNGNKK